MECSLKNVWNILKKCTSIMATAKNQILCRTSDLACLSQYFFKNEWRGYKRELKWERQADTHRQSHRVIERKGEGSSGENDTK